MSDFAARKARWQARWQASGGWLGALLGAAIGTALAFAVGGGNPTVYDLVGLVGTGIIIGFFVGRANGGLFSGGDASSPLPDVCRKIWQVRERLRRDMLSGLDAEDRHAMKRNKGIFMGYFWFASCYALVLIVLASSGGESLDIYLRFFAPLTDAVAGFLPRAVAVREALSGHGYEAGLAEHAIVMMRFFCFVALVFAVANLKILYRSREPSRLACPRHVFDLAHFGTYACLLLFCGCLLLKETGFWTAINFDSQTYGIGKWAQYHRTNFAVLYEVLVAGLYPAVIWEIQMAVMTSRASPVYAE